VRIRIALPLIALLAAGCGSDTGGLNFDLRTPPPYVGAAPVPPPGQKPVDRKMTHSDAERFKGVIAQWAAAVRRGDATKAAGFFDLPAIIYQPGHSALQVNTPQIAEAFNASLPCGAKLLGTSPEGRYVVATFVLVRHGSARCPGKGSLARVGFVFGDQRHPRRFTEWWQVSDSPDSKVGPDKRPTVLTPATISDFS
jgi:hypothetical protein